MVIVDALLDGDAAALQSALDPLRDHVAALRDPSESTSEARGWLLACLAVLRWGLQRLPSAGDLVIRQETQAREFLEHLRDHGLRSSAQLKEAIGTDDSQISRVGRGLLAGGLVLQRRGGRQVFWELTPRGVQLMRQTNRDHDGPQQHAGGGGGRHRSPRGGSRQTGETRSQRTHRAAPRAAGGSATGVYYSGPSIPDTRFIVETESGWKISTTADGRASQIFDAKDAAVRRSREILKKRAGGEIHVTLKSGKKLKPIVVAAEARRSNTA
jgi:DNA-binding MarR family transcriptional regulator